MTATMNMNMLQKKFTLLAATLMLAFGFNATQVQEAQAGRDGRVIAGVIAGAALVGILASRRHRHRDHYYGRSRAYHYHGRRSARCYRRHAGYKYGRYRGRHYGRRHHRHHRRHHGRRYY